MTGLIYLNFNALKVCLLIFPSLFLHGYALYLPQIPSLKTSLQSSFGHPTYYCMSLRTPTTFQCLLH